MKLEHQSFLPFSTVFLVTGFALVGACLSLTSVDAFVSNSPIGGSRLVLPRSSSTDGSSSLQLSNCRDGYNSCFEASPRGRNYRDRQRQHAEEAFRELQRELEDINNAQKKRAAKFGGPQSYYSPFGTPGFVVGGMPPIDGDAAKKWIEKAFDVASEFNGDFATTPKERDANEEFLRKSRKWAEQILESSTTSTSDTDDSKTADAGTKSTTETQGTASPSSQQSTATDKTDKNNEVAVETPNLENTSDEDTFRVAVDLPGVEKDDVDVTVEDDFLVVRGTRYSRQTRNRRFTDAAAGNTDAGEEVPSTVTPKTPLRKYEKKIAFVESEVEIEEMEASFENGVLVVSAPKKKVEPPPKDDVKHRIPIA